MREDLNILTAVQKKGHYEIDVVKGKNGKNEACIITLVDRKSRYTHILFLAKLNAENIKKALQKLFKKFQFNNLG